MNIFDYICNVVGDASGIPANIIRPFLGTVLILALVKCFKVVVSAMIRDLSKKRSRVYDRVHNFSMFVDILTVFLLVLFLGRYIENLTTFISLLISSLTLALKDIVVNGFYGIYIRRHKLFKIGDRIEVSGVKGDVVNFSRLSFDILEVSSEDHGQSTGCIITLPYNFAASKEIKNYNKGINSLWTELKVNIPRDEDLNKTKEVIYNILDSIDEIKEVPLTIDKELALAQVDYKIYYKDCKPIIYTKVTNKYYELDVRYLMYSKKIRNIEEEIWNKLIEADKKGDIKLYKE